VTRGRQAHGHGRCWNTGRDLDHHLHAQEETLTTNPRQRARLRLAPPAAPLPDDRVEVARALLRRYTADWPVISDEMLAFLGWDGDALDELERDPRYLIGRFTQAIAELLQREMPPLDATAQLLGEAIADAMKYRRISCAACGPEYVCPACEPSWHRAHQYETLYGLLGIIGNHPAPRPELKAAGR
jgi:hypothetical protein